MSDTAQKPRVPPGNVTGAVRVAEPPRRAASNGRWRNTQGQTRPPPSHPPQSKTARRDLAANGKGVVFVPKLAQDLGKCEHHPVWFAGGHNPTRNRLSPSITGAPTLSSSPRVSRWPKGLPGGISLHHSPLMERSRRFFPRGRSGAVMESLAGVIYQPGVRAGGQRALGSWSRVRAAGADRASGGT